MTNPITTLTNFTYSFAPPVASVICDDIPTLPEIRSCLNDHAAVQLDECREAVGTGLALLVEGAYIVCIDVQDITLPLDAFYLHPYLAQECAQHISHHHSVLQVSLRPAAQLREINREERLQQLAIHARIVAALARLAGAVAVHNTESRTTIDAAVYASQIHDYGQLAIALAPVWVYVDQSMTTAFTYGLRHTGHPELQVSHSFARPGKLYEQLTGLVEAIVAGGTIVHKQEIQLADGTVPIPVAPTGWVVDPSQPAMALKI